MFLWRWKQGTEQEEKARCRALKGIEKSSISASSSSNFFQKVFMYVCVCVGMDVMVIMPCYSSKWCGRGPSSL